MAAASIQYCKVKGCRFSNFHTTVAHRCGTCFQHGHGQMECNDVGAKSSLTEYINDQMPSYAQCTFLSCLYPWSHSNQSHHCYMCGKRGAHSAKQCHLNPSNELVQTMLVGGGAATKHGEVINDIGDGGGANIINKICPMCMSASDVDLNLKIFTDSPCGVCIESNPKIIFSGCNHANVCHKCILLI